MFFMNFWKRFFLGKILHTIQNFNLLTEAPAETKVVEKQTHFPLVLKWSQNFWLTPDVNYWTNSIFYELSFGRIILWTNSPNNHFKCKHIFYYLCLKGVTNHNNKCPLCRHVLYLYFIFINYLIKLIQNIFFLIKF
jgi:hypothetical protein